MAEAFGDGADEPFLLLEEWADVLLGPLLQVPHAEPSHHPVPGHDVGGLDPGRRTKVLELELLVLELDDRLTDIRILPAGRDHLHDPLEDLLQREVEAGEYLLDLVQAVELLGTLLEGGEQPINRAFVLSHRLARSSHRVSTVANDHSSAGAAVDAHLEGRGEARVGDVTC